MPLYAKCRRAATPHARVIWMKSRCRRWPAADAPYFPLQMHVGERSKTAKWNGQSCFRGIKPAVKSKPADRIAKRRVPCADTKNPARRDRSTPQRPWQKQRCAARKLESAPNEETA